MILIALAAACAAASPIDDYFPLIPGTRLTYVDGNGLQMVEEVGKPVELPRNETATPKSFSVSGRSSGSELFRNENDTAYYVGYSDGKGKHLSEPQPRLRVGSGKMEWQYVSDVPSELGPVSCRVRGDSSKGPRRKVLDREIETLIVHVTSQLGSDAQRVEVRDDVIYGKGIGMIEMTEATKAQGQTVKKVLKLVKFEPPEG